MNYPPDDASPALGKGILGLHHVTATVDQAQPDLTFYRDVLGLRLVKRTVNFDNPRVYHLYYGNGTGEPGTLMTTFPYGGWGVRQGVHGNGQIAETRFAIPEDTSRRWSARLSSAGLDVAESPTPFGEPSVLVYDPSGLAIRMVEAPDDRAPWSGGDVEADMAITGVHSVLFPVTAADPSIEFACGLLGGEVAAREGTDVRISVGEGVAGRTIDVRSAPEGDDGINGLGTVHHVALAVQDDETQAAFRHRILDAGYAVTEVRDRQYFRSIYFREPGGLLYEIATVPPGFGVDEPAQSLGEDLKLPPWEERNRAAIMEGLPPLD